MRKIINIFLPVFFLSLIVGGAAGTAAVLYLPKFFPNYFTSSTREERTLQVQEESATTNVVEKVSPSVVTIIGKADLSKYYEGDIFLFNPGFSVPEGKQEVSGGSGFIISSDGLILTNRHVVDQDLEYSVVLSDGTSYDVSTISRDTLNDLAVVKIEAQNLPVFDLGDSDTLKVGETVMAIGDPLGNYQNTVTKGIVSGLGRELSTDYKNLIQTDAAINKGNSGGPLVNLSGQVVGINVAIDRTGGAESIGFAIPVNEAKYVIDSVKQSGKIIRPMLGVRYRPITLAFAKRNSLTYNYGVIVLAPDADTLAVVPGSPADKAGIKAEDILLEIDGKKIDEKNPLASLIARYRVGDTITLKIFSDGEEKEISITLAELLGTQN